jgi:hypothetical protein
LGELCAGSVRSRMFIASRISLFKQATEKRSRDFVYRVRSEVVNNPQR